MCQGPRVSVLESNTLWTPLNNYHHAMQILLIRQKTRLLPILACFMLYPRKLRRPTSLFESVCQ